MAAPIRRLQQDPAHHHPPAEEKLPLPPPRQFYEVDYKRRTHRLAVKFPNQICPSSVAPELEQGERQVNSWLPVG